ncbi:cation:proton antiporter [bacterium]|nr:cation:proton antiporter [bacterium]
MNNPRTSRYIFSLILTVLLGYAVFAALGTQGGTLRFGPHSPTSRVSGAMIEKNIEGARPNLTAKNHTGPSNVSFAPGSKGLENGAANIVSSIVADYRSFDTFGEVLILFAAVTGFMLLLPDKKGKNKGVTSEAPNFVLVKAAPIVFAFAMITGIYISFNGHLTPGGGFAGGAVIATGILILVLSGNEFNSQLLSLTETIAGMLFLAVGAAGLVLKGNFLQNVIPTGVLGYIFSSGIVLALNLIIGLKVGAELGSLILAGGKKEI